MEGDATGLEAENVERDPLDHDNGALGAPTEEIKQSLGNTACTVNIGFTTI